MDIGYYQVKVYRWIEWIEIDRDRKKLEVDRYRQIVDRQVEVDRDIWKEWIEINSGQIGKDKQLNKKEWIEICIYGYMYIYQVKVYRRIEWIEIDRDRLQLGRRSRQIIDKTEVDISRYTQQIDNKQKLYIVDTVERQQELEQLYR